MLERVHRSNRFDRVRHHSVEAAVDTEWEHVTEQEPCPVCGRDSGCQSHTQGAFVCCVRCPSEWLLTNGGWLHRVARERSP